MARTVEQIEWDMAVLQEATDAIASEFHNTYNQYLTALGQAMRQQLIQAIYYICTQAYPEAFLSLPVDARQKLQQNLLQLARKAQTQLLLHLPRPIETAANSVPTTNLEDIAKWQEQLESAISETLISVSCDINSLLQETGILPNKFPPAVLEAAVKTEPSGQPVGGRPNIIKLAIEIANDEIEMPEFPTIQNSNVTPIVAIHLRLSEIEFADSTVMAFRNQIRNLNAQFTTLRREFQKKQRERTVADAQAAWRACWFEE
ncbi:hypothetical protein H6F74_01425 [Trichocoleus sp. FACHB-90]|uniref:hypothetical protein n=1 Tax=Cyanophyceae TaxID=3028117 RepID=UPI001681D79C|nr:hypothetical protein [Trichocoleus sp. FACHB-90]MBD1924950.1 hypothetical protein [Trichocoleus sp. FACHB-90]